MKKLLSLILATAAIATGFGGCSGASSSSGAAQQASSEDPITLKLTHSLSTTSQYQAGAEYFKQLVEERSGGAITVEIYPNAQLGAERDTFEGLTLGTVDIALGTASVLGQTFTMDTDVFSLPFLCNDSEEFYALLDSDLAKEIFSGTADHGAEVLTCYDSGFRQLSNGVRPVNGVADCAGLKIRTPESSMYVDTMEALGISPSTLAWSEVFSALQTGVVDGQETPIAVFTSSGLGEVQKHFAFINYMNDPIAMVASTSFLSKLTEEQQQLIREAAYESAVYEREWLADYEASCIQENEETFGVAFTYPDTAEFQERVTGVYESYGNQELLAQVQEFLASARGAEETT